MNINELDSYNLADAVKFNDQLNPRIWDSNEHLRPEVRDRLLAIADDFRESLGIRDLAVEDITISGSNAAYTYTPNSDIDLHLLVDVPDDEVYRELFNAKKFQYNEQHDINIGGADVELYVQDTKEPHISQGIYSVKNNKWISVPRRVKSVVDDTSTKHKFETIGHQIERAIASGNETRMQRMIDKIKKMRQTGLEKHGEFGPENLAFKLLRNQGLIKQLYTARTAAKDQELSLDEQGPQQPFVYGFKSVAEASSPDGVSPETKMFLSEQPPVDDEAVLQDFVDFCVKELKIDSLPKIKLRRDPQWPVVHKTFGRYINDRDLLEVAWGQRHLMDVLRTVAHELTHRHQHERDGDRMGPEAGETGSEWENEANARAGILMRDYGRLHPDLFGAGEAHNLDEGLRSRTAAAAIVATLLGQPVGAVAQSIQGILGAIRDAATVAQQAKNITRAGLNSEVQQEIVNYVRGVGGDSGSQNLSQLYQLQRQLQQQEQQQPPQDAQRREPQNESASGYIPTKRQARDPRYSMALTVDIKPGQVGREANKLKLRTDSQGHPQIARPNGLFEQLMMELTHFQTLDEVRMSPRDLQRFADSPAAQGIRAGFEAELIFGGWGEPENEELEPDMDADERAYSIDAVIEFFQNDDWGYGISDRRASRLQDELDERYMEWYDEAVHESFRDQQDELVEELWLEERPMVERIHVALTDGLELTDEEADDIMALQRQREQGEIKGSEMNDQQLEMISQYSEARSIAEDVLREDVANSINMQDGIYDQALEQFREDFVPDDSSFFSDVGLRWMSNIADEYGLDWPVMQSVGGGEGGWSDDSADMLAKSLSHALGVPTKVSRGYHSATRDNTTWILEPDSSLDPDDPENMPVEIVSPPMPLAECLKKMEDFFSWAESNDAYANRSTGFHMGVSLPTRFHEDVDFVKLALFLGDEYVLKEFGRNANTYCESAMKKIRNRLGNDRSGQAVSGALDLIKNNLIELAHRSIANNQGFGKYTSINPKGNYIEFRSAGNRDYFKDIDKLKNTLLRYARAMSIAGNPAAERNEYYKKLYKLIAPAQQDPALALFAKYSAGELTAEQLKHDWAELALIKERPKSGEQRDWEAVDLGTGQVLGTVRDSSITNATNYFRDTLKLDGFQVREREPEATSARAKLAKRIKQPKAQAKDDDQDSEQLQARLDPEVAQIPRNWEFYRAETGNVIDRVDGINMMQANAVRADLVRRYGHPDESVRMRSIPSEQSAARIRGNLSSALDNVTNTDLLDTGLDVAQNFPEPAGTQVTVAGVPNWSIYNVRTGDVVRTFFQRDYQDAMVYAGQWLEANGYGSEGYAVRATMEVNESADFEKKLNQLLQPTNLEQDPQYRREQRRLKQQQQALKQVQDRVRAGYDVEPNDLDPIDEAVHWPDIESAKRAFVANPRLQHLPVSTRQAMGAAAYQKQKNQSTNLADRLKTAPTRHWQDIDEAYYRVPDHDIFPDGDMFFTGHAKLDRFPEREIDTARVIDLCRQAGRLYPNKLSNLGDTELVIQDPDEFGVALLKQELPSGRYRYVVKTARDHLRHGKDQTVLRVIDENFADGKKPGRKGLAKRMGVNTKASVSSLRKTAKNSSGEKARMAHWLANMKAGKKK